MRGLNEPALLGDMGPPHHGVQGQCVAPGPAFHLVKHKGSPVRGDDIHLRAAPAPVALEDAVSLLFEFFDHERLPEAASPGATFQNHGARMRVKMLGHDARFTGEGLGFRAAGSAQDQVGGADDLGAFEDFHAVGAGVEAQGRVAVCAVVENAGVQAFARVIDGAGGAELSIS